jgi:hypothetical protein
MRTATALLAALSLPLASLPLAAPALAKNDKTPPGDPCGKGNGNPCNGNNGNSGSQGNNGGKNSVTTGAAGRIDVDAPAFNGRNVFITQIGASNVAVATQTAPDARIDMRQDGDRNRAEATQRGTGPAFARIGQIGDGHLATVEQGGVGRSSLYVEQKGGDRNQAFVTQNTAGALYNGAVLAQSGFDNTMSLRQDGQDNRALLSQEGDLQITQTGGGSLSITQTNGK